jgi:tRNA threonylcarbamoyladenosine biosynthesis protein TsaB
MFGSLALPDLAMHMPNLFWRGLLRPAVERTPQRQAGSNMPDPTRTLALETSLFNGSLALLEDGKVIADRALDPSMRTAQSLAPAMRDLLTACGWQPQDVVLVAVATGPGSFTGLRVGITAAKTFAYAAAAKVVGINTLDVVAAQFRQPSTRLWAILDAQRSQLFAAQYRCDSARRPQLQSPAAIIDREAWLQALEPEIAVTGPALRLLRDRIPESVVVAAESDWPPQAATLGELGYERFQSGQRDDLWSLKPQYFRKSAAEEKLESTS